MTDRYEIAWLIWAMQQGYMTPEDRDGLRNWLRDPEDTLTETDISQKNACLSIADTLISVVKEEVKQSETESQEDDFEPSDWWKVVGSDGIWVIETKDEQEAWRILFAYPGSKMFRSFEKRQSDIQWREVNDD